MSEFSWTIHSFLVHMHALDYDGSYDFPPKETQRIRIIIGPAKEYVFLAMIPVFAAIPPTMMELIETNW